MLARPWPHEAALMMFVHTSLMTCISYLVFCLVIYIWHALVCLLLSEVIFHSGLMLCLLHNDLITKLSDAMNKFYPLMHSLQ